MSIILINQYKGEPTVYIEYLVLGGGGGGGGPTGNGMGGGGGGGVTTGSRYAIIKSTQYSISVGAGGAIAGTGGASSFESYVAGGGGAGGSYGGGSGAGGSGLNGASGGGGGTNAQGANPVGGSGGSGLTSGGNGVYQYNTIGSSNYYSIAGGGGGGYSSGGASAVVTTQTDPFGAITGYSATPGAGGSGNISITWGQFSSSSGGGGGYGGSGTTASAGAGGGNGNPGGGGNAAQTGGAGLVFLRHPKEFPLTYVTSGLAAGYPVNDGTYIIYKWATSGSIIFSPIYVTVEYLVVGGGGAAGAAGSASFAGGGGAGGFRTASDYTVIANINFTVTVGAAGASSTFDTIVSAAGGAGGAAAFYSYDQGANGIAGASGGGGAGRTGYQDGATTGGAGTVGQGNVGGSGSLESGGVSAGGGGGGAGGPGGAGTSQTSIYGGSGASGQGATSSITGVSRVYARGGAGGSAGRAGNGTEPADVNANDGSIYGNGGTPLRGGVSPVAPTSGVVILAFQNDYIPAITYGTTSLVYTIDKTARPGYSVYTFTSGTGAIAVKPIDVTVEYLIVGGGGVSVVGGGGAGGMIENTVDVVAGQSFQLKVGAGGTYPNFGAYSPDWTVGYGKESYFSPQPYNHIVPYAVSGGGYGAGQYAPGNGGGTGGSGGGGWAKSSSYNFGGQGTSSAGYTQGYAGGSVNGNAYPDNTEFGGGGGGAGGPGIGRTGATPCAGGPPRASSITGSTRYYAAGGDGTINSGFGVDKLGSIYGNGGGTSGVVILAYPFSHAQLTITGTLTHTVDTTSRPGYRIYTFTAGTGQVTF